MQNVTHLRTTNPVAQSSLRNNKWLNRVVAIAAIIYVAAFFARIIRSYLSREAGLDIDWTVPANPQSMIALCWIAAALSLCFLHEGGKILAIFSLGGIIAFFVHWASVTEQIRINMGVSAIPGAGWIGNIWIGAGLIDVIAFIAAIGVLGWNLTLLWRNNFTRGAHHL